MMVITFPKGSICLLVFVLFASILLALGLIPQS